MHFILYNGLRLAIVNVGFATDQKHYKGRFSYILYNGLRLAIVNVGFTTDHLI